MLNWNDGVIDVLMCSRVNLALMGNPTIEGIVVKPPTYGSKYLLLVNQTDPKENGVWTLKLINSSTVWERVATQATDTQVNVTTGAGKGWWCIQDVPVYDTDAVTVVRCGAT